MTSTKQVVVKFAVERKTPNTVRYAEIVPDSEVAPLIRTLYLQNHTVKALGNPETITVTIEAGGPAL
jgi:hypothetical protein